MPQLFSLYANGDNLLDSFFGVLVSARYRDSLNQPPSIAYDNRHFRPRRSTGLFDETPSNLRIAEFAAQDFTHSGRKEHVGSEIYNRVTGAGPDFRFVGAGLDLLVHAVWVRTAKDTYHVPP